MDFEEKLIKDLGEEERTIFPTIVYGCEKEIVYLDVLIEEKCAIECRGFNASLFETMNIEAGTKIWVDLFTQPGKILIKVKEVIDPVAENFPIQIFEELYKENRIIRPAGPLLYKKRHVLELFTIFK